MHFIIMPIPVQKRIIKIAAAAASAAAANPNLIPSEWKSYLL